MKTIPHTITIKDILQADITVNAGSIDKFLKYAANIGHIALKNKNPQALERIVFVSPQLPHPSELEIWNSAAAKIGAEAIVATVHSEKKAFDFFAAECIKNGNQLKLSCHTLDTVSENRTFLTGLETLLADASIVVTVGESSLATYQVVKARRLIQNRMVVWQTSPRPPESMPYQKSYSASSTQDLARMKSVRKEVLKACDAIITFDKDSSTWAYLEGVNAQRIKRISRGIDLKKFSIEMNASQRITLRASLGLPETDFIFLQAGGLEIETGALDTIYAFKSLLQSNPAFVNNTKLVFCGTGSAAADIKQAVVDLQLDNHIFFLNPNDQATKDMLGNQLANLLCICDTLIHNPLTAVNGSSSRYLDCTYDVLCALASGLTVISNGNGWIGDFMARFLKTFSSSSIHSQSKLMRDSIDKQERLNGVKKSIRAAIETELSLEKAATELAGIFQSLTAAEAINEGESLASVFSAIEETIKSKKYLDAIQLISTTFENKNLTDSQKAALFRHIGDCFTKLGDMDNGSQNYMRAIELDPYCTQSYIGLGTIALQRRENSIAIPYFQKAISLAPNNDLANLGLALTFESLGRLKDALQLAYRACSLNIENTAAIFNLVRISYDLEEYEEAEIIISKYVSIHPYDVNMTFTLAGIAFKLGKYEMATKLTETILMLDPHNSRAHGLIHQINKKNIERKQA